MTELRVDEKGRLKLPPVVQQYIRSFGDAKVFVTSMDGAQARIYPISVWVRNEKLLQKPGPNAKLSNKLQLLAMIFGQEGEMDSHGRVLLPTNLRRELELEGEPVWITCITFAIENILIPLIRIVITANVTLETALVDSPYRRRRYPGTECVFET